MHFNRTFFLQKKIEFQKLYPYISTMIEYNCVTRYLIYLFENVAQINAAIPIPDYIQFLSIIYIIYRFNLLSSVFVLSAIMGVLLYNLFLYKITFYTILFCIPPLLIFRNRIKLIFRTILYYAFINRGMILNLPEFSKSPLGKYRYYIKNRNKTTNITYFIILNCDFTESYTELLEKCKAEFPNMKNLLIITNLLDEYVMNLKKGVEKIDKNSELDISFNNVWLHMGLNEDNWDDDGCVAPRSENDARPLRGLA